MGDQMTRGDGMMMDTENDRFKRSSGSWLWGSMIAAAAFHFILFWLWP